MRWGMDLKKLILLIDPIYWGRTMYRVRHFTCITSFNPPNNPVGEGHSLSHPPHPHLLPTVLQQGGSANYFYSKWNIFFPAWHEQKRSWRVAIVVSEQTDSVINSERQKYLHWDPGSICFQPQSKNHTAVALRPPWASWRQDEHSILGAIHHSIIKTWWMLLFWWIIDW